MLVILIICGGGGIFNMQEREDLPKFIRECNGEKLLDFLKKFPVQEEFSLQTCYFNVMVLLDMMEVINKNADQLKNPISKNYLKRKAKPSAILVEYIILEISNYYTKIHLMRKKGFKFPEPPIYWEILKDYRNKNPGHRDKEHEFKTLADYVSSIKKLDSLSLPRVVNDFLEYHKKINIIQRPNSEKTGL